MRRAGAWIGLFIAFAALSVGCLPKPYEEGDPTNDPGGESREPEAPTGAGTKGPSSGAGPSGSPAPAGTTGPSGGSSGSPAPTPSSSPGPVLEPGQELIFEKFEGTLAFAAKQGTLTVVPRGTGKAGRVCAASTGVGGIEWMTGPPPAGTYTVTANVQQDSTAPGNTFNVEATSYSPGPDARKNQGDLAVTVTSVKSTVQVSSGAFAVVFAVRIGTTPGTCMLVDDIRVVKAP